MAEDKGKAKQQNEGNDNRTENVEEQRGPSKSEGASEYAQPVKPMTMWQAPQSLLRHNDEL